MCKLKLLSFILALSGFFTAQDYHFSQFDKSLMVLNPAAVGDFDGFERFSIQNRNQWIGAGTQFMTTMASAELTFGKSARNNNGFVGLGIFFLNDVGGDSKFGMTSGGISISGNLPLAKGHRLAAGLQTSFNNRNADFSNLSFYSQWNGITFDPSIPVDEPNQLASFSYVDAGLGANYTYNKKSNSSMGGKDFILNSGFFIQHLNQPKLRYNALTLDRLNAKYGIYNTTTIGFNSRSGLELKVGQFFQGKHYEGVYGAFYKLRFKGSSRVTNLINDKNISVGSYFRSTGAAIPACFIDFGTWRFGVSYDQELGRIARAYRSSLEFSFGFTLTKRSMFSGKKL